MDKLGGQINHILEQNSHGRNIFSRYKGNRSHEVSNNLLQHFCPLLSCYFTTRTVGTKKTCRSEEKYV